MGNQTHLKNPSRTKHVSFPGTCPPRRFPARSALCPSPPDSATTTLLPQALKLPRETHQTDMTSRSNDMLQNACHTKYVRFPKYTNETCSGSALAHTIQHALRRPGSAGATSTYTPSPQRGPAVTRRATRRRPREAADAGMPQTASRLQRLRIRAPPPLRHRSPWRWPRSRKALGLAVGATRLDALADHTL